ncbi:hypothetical protein LTR64_005370 [Lithohypha guttulata]|uniref:uncharacterized protein n=1 Tax=Lithohypha guttulata TaxID=1690604 RepID=UPI002DE0BCD2|nr:hypothetical protein LTR51_002835 [Lithohypha guttulata]
MATVSRTDPAIQDILDYWFGLSPKDWFMGSASQDAIIKERFAPLVEKARLTDELNATWTSTPSGSLALVILLDQFTRNIFRVGNHEDPGLSFSGDVKALRLASEAIAKGYDRQIQQENESKPLLGVPHRYFFYLPFMHAENLPSQIACRALFEVMKQEGEVAQLKRLAEGKEDSEAEKTIQDLVEKGCEFSQKHLDCVSALGRFPKRNEPLGRGHTETERQWLEVHPMGF